MKKLIITVAIIILGVVLYGSYTYFIQPTRAPSEIMPAGQIRSYGENQKADGLDLDRVDAGGAIKEAEKMFIKVQDEAGQKGIIILPEILHGFKVSIAKAKSDFAEKKYKDAKIQANEAILLGIYWLEQGGFSNLR